jgi:3'-5' exoribonuclease
MMARVWENAEETSGGLATSEVVKMDGEVDTFLERVQVRVLRVRPADSNEYDLRDLLPTSSRDREQMLNEMRTFIDRVENPHLRSLLSFFFDDPDFIGRFTQAPAALRIHHAYMGGLLEHTIESLALTKTVIDLYPQVDPDILISAVLLHDIGKMREYTWDIDISYSDEGRLIGHIVMTDEMVTAALSNLPEFPADLALYFRHTLLAHHGRHEWGSPRRPKTLEAIALHHIENLSAQINRFHLLLEDRQPGEDWTSYDRRLHRQLYAGSDDLNIEERGLIQ